MQKLIAQRDSGKVQRPGQAPTMAEWLTHWIENIAPRTSKFSTISGYRTVICTSFRSLARPLVPSIKESGMEVRRQLADGLVDLPRVGKVVKVPGDIPPYRVVDEDKSDVEAVTEYLRDLVLSDCSPKTIPAYASDLLRWFRLLWAVDVPWEKATEAEVALLVGWMREAGNPQRRSRAV